MSMRNAHTEQFRSMPARILGELSERVEMRGRALKYHHAFLDDVLRGILPNDLVLIGAPTGLGKTDLAMSIAATNAMLGRNVHYFALEAEPRELERRTKFAMLSNLAHGANHPQVHTLNYADWLLGECEEVCQHFNAQVDKIITKKLATFWTYYRGQVFGAADLKRQVLDIHEESDLIVIDHLHYIDLDSDENEARAMGDTVKAIRDVALRVGKPVILIAHLRKREQGSRRLVPTEHDFHGSSNIVKICTQAIAIERCHVVKPAKWYLAPTFMTVLKDRRAGAPPFIAVTNFDRRKKSYESHYTLGRLEKNGAEWNQLELGEEPSWAKHHKPLEAA
jgi:KaiC/GvpD/RAD55 family RecA-like ATPase